MLTHANLKTEKTTKFVPNNANSRLHQGQSVAVKSLLAGQSIQYKLKLGAANDKFEQEADQVADQVMRMPNAPANDSSGPSASKSSIVSSGVSDINSSNIQRECAGCEEEELLQTKGNAAGKTTEIGADTATQINAIKAGGSFLPASERAFFEPRFGADFSQVRIHNDRQSHESAVALNAKAYTIGRDVAFAGGEYRPGTFAGRQLLAHELTHTIQQGQAGSHVQRSCFDGDCEDCADGWKNLWVTVFFARRANRATMNKLRARMDRAKGVLANCCVRLKFDFNWTLIPGAATVETASRHRRPAGDANGIFDVPEPQETIGESALIAGAKGIPLLIVDEVTGTGGATTMLGGQDDRGNEYDVEYTGPSMFIMAVNQPREGNCSSDDLTIAHELWHITGALRHNAADGAITDCSGEGVAEPYCTAIRGIT